MCRVFFLEIPVCQDADVLVRLEPMGMKSDGGGSFAMGFAVVYDQRFGGNKVMFVNDMLEHGRAGLAVVEVAAEKDFVETLAHEVATSFAVDIFAEIPSVGDVAVA